MTLPPQENDPRPVVLQEPERDLAPAWQTSANKGFVLRPEEEGVPGLHPSWAQVLAPGETVLWHGSATPDPRFAGARVLARGPMPLFLFGIFGMFIALNMGMSGGLVPFILIALFWVLRKDIKAARVRVSSDRRYLLTNRAAYLARADGNALFDIQAFPITPTLRLGLGPRSVAFTTRRNAKGEEEAEGFLDINDAAAVHAMIRDVQQGRDMGRADQWGGDGAR